MQLGAQLTLCRGSVWCCRSGLRLLCQSCTHRKSLDYYSILGIKSDATLEEIKTAFFNKSKKLHPDSDPLNPALHGQFVQLNEAYRVLSKELSRKEYDFKIRHRYSGGPGHAAYKASTEAQDNRFYWEQFRHAHSPKSWSEERQRMRGRNARLVCYCILTMLLSIGAHVVFFSKLEDVHTKFMDEKDRVITQIYNESKERARVNGFKKQTEILRQRHAEFIEKYRHPSRGDAK